MSAASSDRRVTLIGGPFDGHSLRIGPGVFRIDTSATIDTGYAYRPREKDAAEWHYEQVEEMPRRP